MNSLYLDSGFPVFLEEKTPTFPYLEEKIRQINAFVQENILKPIAVGVIGGTCEVAVELLFQKSLFSMGFEKALVGDPAAIALYEAEYMSDPLGSIVIGPIFEELLFRVFIQDAFEQFARLILPDIDVTCFSSQIKLATLVSIIGSSILFGLAHLSNGIGLLQPILCVMAGITFGLLNHFYGLPAPISAHMTNNAIAYLFNI
jgi:membrane protease YdiL (CAAX protease family)